MAKLVFSRNDILALAIRLDRRAETSLLRDMPETQRDLRSASRLITFFLAHGMPVSLVEIENGDNGFSEDR
jgi:hypothetical protein